jgi:hypothetical protein
MPLEGSGIWWPSASAWLIHSAFGKFSLYYSHLFIIQSPYRTCTCTVTYHLPPWISFNSSLSVYKSPLYSPLSFSFSLSVTTHILQTTSEQDSTIQSNRKTSISLFTQNIHNHLPLSAGQALSPTRTKTASFREENPNDWYLRDREYLDGSDYDTDYFANCLLRGGVTIV